MKSLNNNKLGLFIIMLFMMSGHVFGKIQISVVSKTKTQCYGTATGSVTLRAIGGLNPYEFKVSGGVYGSSTTINNLVAGSYMAYAKDANGDIDSISFSITDAPQIVVTDSIVDVVCPADKTGAILLSVNGGSGAFIYDWKKENVSVSSSANLSNVASGTYILNLSDINGCTYKDTFVINADNPIQANYTVNDISCFGKGDGSISANVFGTTNTYSISWTGPNGYNDTLSGISNLQQGYYTAIITDDTTNCSISATKFVREPATLEVSVGTSRDVTCAGDSNGIIVPLIKGGTSPFIYNWYDQTGFVSTSSSISAGKAGSYYLYLTDIQGCKDTLTASLSEPDPMLVAASITGVTCYGDADGAIDVTVGLGKPPYIYQWSNGVTAQDLSNLRAGSYNFTVTDSNGCIVNKKFTVTTPDPLDLIYSSKNVSCFGKDDGSFTLIATGGTFPWAYVTIDPQGDTIRTINNKNMSSGLYVSYLSDDNNCLDTVHINIVQPQELTVVESAIDPSCFGLKGSLTTQVSGGVSPYSFEWIDTSGALYAATQNVVSAEPGEYKLKVTDANQCTFRDTLTISEPEEIQFSIKSSVSPVCINDSNGVINLTKSGGTSPYQFQLNGGTYKTDSVFNNLPASRYTIVIKDANQCLDTLGFSLNYLDQIKPTVKLFSPTVYLNSNGSVTINSNDLDNGITDNCELSSIILSKSSFDCSQSGVQKVAVTVTDLSGNITVDTAVINVLDTIKPTLVAKSPTIYLNASGTASLSVDKVDDGSFDNCSIDSLLISKTSFDCSDLGVNNIQLRGKDKSGNESIQTVTVNVMDTIAPVLNYKNINCYLNSSGLGIIDTSMLDDGSFDNCGIAVRTISQTVFNCINLGSNFVTYTIKDKSGNVSSTLVRVTVFDTISPVIKTKTTTLYLNEYGFAVLNPLDIDDNSFDNCRISGRSLSQSVFTCGELGNKVTKLTVFDPSGNATTASVQINVVDTLVPKNKTRNPTVYLDLNVVGRLSIFDVDNGSADNCGISTSTISKDNFYCFERGKQTVEFSSSDNSGNITVSQFEVTVRDTIKPFIRVQPRDVYLNEAGMAIITPAYFDRGSYDNCGIQLKKLSQDTFDCQDLGNAVVLYSVFDSSSNRELEVLNFKVLDTISPKVQVSPFTKYLDQNGLAYLSINEVSPGASDNCGINEMKLSDTVFDCSNIGLNQVFFEVKDNSGNITTAAFFVEVFDTIKPRIVTKDITIFIDTSGTATITPEMMIDSVIENCQMSELFISQERFDFNDQGDNFVFVYGSDDSKNPTKQVIGKVTVLLGDADRDSIPDYIESSYDFDGDGIANYLDEDSDNDGIRDVDENGGFAELLDQDEDGFYNIYDLDLDGDGIFDVLEADGYDVEPYDGRIGLGKVSVEPNNGVPILADGGQGLIEIDTDNDGIPDYKDWDSDNDLIPDYFELGVKLFPVDSDGDETADYRDRDSDGDNISDSLETAADNDLDLIPNYIDLDADGDFIQDFVETSNDQDIDGIGNWLDLDADGDDIPDEAETSMDYDKDGIGNWLDLDSDNDGIDDKIEGNLFTDSDELPDFLDSDSDNDFIPDSIEAKPVVNGIPADTDLDGIYDYLDEDSDNDKILDYQEGYFDFDNDGIANYRDTDSDNDGVADITEGSKDTDGDGLFDAIDDDSDNDGIPDVIETFLDYDGDNVPNLLDLDSDNDGINDLRECGYNDTLGTGQIRSGDTLKLVDILRDVDGDGFPNFMDSDSDGDGISDLFESGNYSLDQNYDGVVDGGDVDGDGIMDAADGYSGEFGDYFDTEVADFDEDSIRNFEDIDSDNDGILDRVETWVDTDGDGYPNFMDRDSDADLIADFIETDADFDGDGIPNFIDFDSDDDGIDDKTERNEDADGDGAPNYLDLDSDNDDIPDSKEGIKDEEKNDIMDFVDPQIVVPEIFTPNNDGINEYLVLRGLKNYPDASIKIFNQWGQMVYDSKGPYRNDWDGTNLEGEGFKQGVVLSEGVYFYILEYNRDNDLDIYKRAPRKGNIYIKP